MRSVAATAIATCFILSAAGEAFAQAVFTKPVRIITTAPGSWGDIGSRLLAQGLTRALGQQVIVDNRGPGGTEEMIRAAPDGHTLLFNGANVWLSPFLRPHITYDPVRDLAPVSLSTRAPNILAVHPSLPVKSVHDLIKLAKARPGELNYGGGTVGATPHLAAELFKAMAGASIVRIAYKGTGPALNALMAGEVQLMFPAAGAAAPHVKSGRMRALAVSSAAPSPLLPDLPTVSASGVPGYESVAYTGMFVRAKTPDAFIRTLNREISSMLERAELRERLHTFGAEPVGGPPEDFAAVIKSEMAKWGKLITESNIREE